MSISNIIGDESSHISADTMERICWCKKHKGELYYDRKTGKFKTVGGCSLQCIKAYVLVLKYSIREEENKKQIESSIITANL